MFGITLGACASRESASRPRSRYPSHRNAAELWMSSNEQRVVEERSGRCVENKRQYSKSMVNDFFHKESVPNWPTILYFSGPTLSTKPYSASYFLRHSNRESSITLGGEITISLPSLYYTGSCKNCPTLVPTSDHLFKLGISMLREI